MIRSHYRECTKYLILGAENAIYGEFGLLLPAGVLCTLTPIGNIRAV